MFNQRLSCSHDYFCIFWVITPEDFPLQTAISLRPKRKNFLPFPNKKKKIPSNQPNSQFLKLPLFISTTRFSSWLCCVMLCSSWCVQWLMRNSSRSTRCSERHAITDLWWCKRCQLIGKGNSLLNLKRDLLLFQWFSKSCNVHWLLAVSNVCYYLLSMYLWNDEFHPEVFHLQKGDYLYVKC